MCRCGRACFLHSKKSTGYIHVATSQILPARYVDLSASCIYMILAAASVLNSSFHAIFGEKLGNYQKCHSFASCCSVLRFSSLIGTQNQGYTRACFAFASRHILRSNEQRLRTANHHAVARLSGLKSTGTVFMTKDWTTSLWKTSGFSVKSHHLKRV